MLRFGRLLFAVLSVWLSLSLAAASWPGVWGTLLKQNGLTHLLKGNEERLKEFLGIDRCLYVPNPAQAVRDELTRNIRAQDHAINATVHAIRSWELSRNSKSATPLVLALAGPIGTGKTETSNLIAEALFPRKTVLGWRRQSQGLLLFQGEDFADTEHQPLAAYHQRIKSELAAHLKKCSGRAVVVFDEVQKIIPGTLDVLLEAMGDRPVLTYAAKDGVQVKHDCSQVIFVLVSDIGVESMLQVMGGSRARSEVDQSKLRVAVKTSLDAQWQRLQFGKAINEVVAFLPFEPADIEEIVQLKFEQLAKEHRGKYWRDLVGSDGLFRHFASDEDLYHKIATMGADGRKSQRTLARYGARNVVNGGPLQRLKAKLMRAIDLSPDESGVYSVRKCSGCRRHAALNGSCALPLHCTLTAHTAPISCPQRIRAHSSMWSSTRRPPRWS